jgi:aryl-alcohol dehydrogenase-like predicted oxidoreductase
VLFKLNDVKKSHETEKILSAYNLTMNDLPHVMIGHALSRPGVKNILVGTRNPKHLAENAKIRLYDEKLYADLQNIK